jgi:hypothetical protein
MLFGGRKHTEELNDGYRPAKTAERVCTRRQHQQSRGGVVVVRSLRSSPRAKLIGGIDTGHRRVENTARLTRQQLLACEEE